MADPRPGSSDRLDSWKAIADHLGREVRTVRRWEQKLGLPVRRVSGGRGHSVFAYVSEIDAWLKATPPALHVGNGNGTDAGEQTAHKFRLRGWQRGIAAMALLLAGVSAVAWGIHQPPIHGGELAFQVREDVLLAVGPSGTERWRYALADDEAATALVTHANRPASVLDHDAGVVVALSAVRRKSGGDFLPGRVLWFTAAGRLVQAFSAQRPVRFGTVDYAPSIITDFQVLERNGRRRVAVSSRDYRWWPSVVTVLDDALQPRGAFANAGWVEEIHWVGADRLLIAGFSNPLDGGMVALLDTNEIDGSSPDWQEDPAFRCTSCGTARPLRYVVFPRSELNRVTASRFNRSRLEFAGSRIVARTVEVMEPDATFIDALYELTPSLEIVRASYSDRYWDLHQALEREGKISHSRASCPDRDGPRRVEMWDRAGGWRSVLVNTPR